MNRIIESHLRNFSKSFGITSEAESIQFEKFSNYSILFSKIACSFDLDDVTTGNGDDGIDGVAVIVDEEIILSKEDAAQAFSTEKRNHDVDIILIQSKTSESFDLGDFLKFKESILRLINSDKYDVPDEIQMAARGVFDVVLENVPKIRYGKPSIFARFVTSGIYQKPSALETAKHDFENQLFELGLFETIDIKFVDRNELTALWVSTYSGIGAKIEMFSCASLPAIAGINEAYLAVVKAKDLVENLLISDDGSLRSQVFEENVRSFLGIDNPVNESISKTINSGDLSTRFPVLNNGITIASPDVRIQGTTLHLENFQIVNGCQTSNVLFENRNVLDDKIMVNLKVVETSNEDVFSELVRATNSQSRIEENQFLSLKPIVRKVESYFNTYENVDGRLYFERRDRQYVGREIPNIRIFSLHNATRCVAAMYCNRPDFSFKYPKMIYKELTDVIFAEDNKEGIFYASCLTLYRLQLLLSNNTVPQKMRRFKWHILPLVRAIMCGNSQVKLNSKIAEKSAEEIIRTMAEHGEEPIKIFNEAIRIIQSTENLSDDRLKRQAILNEFLEKLA